MKTHTNTHAERGEGFDLFSYLRGAPPLVWPRGRADPVPRGGGSSRALSLSLSLFYPSVLGLRESSVAGRELTPTTKLEPIL